MNILFFTNNKVCSTSGGTERTTVSVATGLMKKYGCNCFSLYEIDSISKKEDCFVEEFCWADKTKMEYRLDYMKDIVDRFHISFVIIQGSFIHTKLFAEKLVGTGCKVIFAHHFEPGSEKNFFSFEYVVRHISYNSIKGFCRSIINILFFPQLYKKNLASLKNNYINSYVYADKLVLLSQSFIEPYREFAGINETNKFVIIPNALSFNEFCTTEELSRKGKNVLIVARFDDKFKNISLALRIWDKVQKSPIAHDWKLRIVGHGKDRKLYEEIITNEHIPNVSLEGRQNPVPYYKEASLFMMTSNSESWGLTLTEAMQFGVVPIAINTYPSLSDIITDKSDGIIMPNGDIEKYANEMLNMMKNRNTIQSMSLKAIESSKRFAQNVIADKWFNMLNSLSK